MSLRLANPMSALVWLAFFVPGFLWDGRVEEIFGALAILTAATVLVSMPSPWETRPASRQAAVIFALLQFLLVVSFAYSAAFNGVQTGPADWLALPRWLGCGVLAVYLIRHHDEQVVAALDSAAIAASYAGWLVFLKPELGFVCVLLLVWLLFFSKSPRRFAHAAAAAASAVYSGNHHAWVTAMLVVCAALAVLVGDDLAGRRMRHAGQLSLLAFLLLVSCSFLGMRAARAKEAASPGPQAVAPSAALRAIRESPVLGWGPARYEAASSVRSQYLLWTLRGGALSAAVILAGLVLLAGGLVRGAAGDYRVLPGVWVFLGAVALMLAGGQYLEGWRSFLLTGFFAVGVREASR